MGVVGGEGQFGGGQVLVLVQQLVVLDALLLLELVGFHYGLAGLRGGVFPDEEG